MYCHVFSFLTRTLKLLKCVHVWTFKLKTIYVTIKLFEGLSSSKQIDAFPMSPINIHCFNRD